MKNIIKDWLTVAKDDMATVRELLKADVIITGSATFYCQQAIEKYFKAFLIEHSWELEKTHDLIHLFKEIKKIKDFAFSEEMIIKIYSKFRKIRYPDNYNPPTEEEVREYFQFALEVEKKIKEELM
ncbi:MAG: HEPN domain-containing protein [Endomicrobium sp.]|jgi:HEPN domain-containing protein|nr:HEPN domain-containing protein [Endomicrobium sp.]